MVTHYLDATKETLHDETRFAGTVGRRHFAYDLLALARRQLGRPSCTLVSVYVS